MPDSGLLEPPVGDLYSDSYKHELFPPGGGFRRQPPLTDIEVKDRPARQAKGDDLEESIGQIMKDPDTVLIDAPKETPSYAQADDPNRPSITLNALSIKTQMRLLDLYGRANGRRLLIATDKRTPAGERRVFEDQIHLVLAPKRGERAVPPPTPTPAAAQPVTVVLDESQVTRALTRDHTIRKTIKLVRQGHLTAEEGIVLIEGVLKD